MSEIGPLPADVLPPNIRSRFVDGVNAQRVHVLEAGPDDAGTPGVLLLHGFPELAFSWRHLMPPLAAAGYRVVAPDLRGYGRTTPDPVDYDEDLAPYRRLNLVRDVLGLVAALGFRSIRVVGHDFGSSIAAWCAVIRPDVFTAVVLMSAPFAGTPDMRDGSGVADHSDSLHEDLARLERPRKHYQRYYQTREANANMWHAPQGVHDLLRGYFHYKSADWKGNRPFRLAERTASQMAKMPTYYVMELDDGMAETVAKYMPSAAEVACNRWLTDEELSVYAGEWERTGFQGGLNHYRSGAVGVAEQQLFAGRRIEQPSVYIAGASDWGSHQSPGALERMADEACADLRGVHLVGGAGHWVQQEQAQETARLLLSFFAGQKDAPEPALASGTKSRVTVRSDGQIRKVYKGPGDAGGRYAREVGFYRHYRASPLIPELLECLPAETAIVIGRAPGVPCSTLDPSPDLRRHLSRDYAEKAVALIDSGGDAAAVKMSHFGGQGAADFRRGTLALLDGYQAVSRRCGQILDRVTASVRDAPITEELLIKLDWNASNVFVDDGAISGFIDFEQAFVGTREMLAGILLHNPFWCARSVFEVMHRRGVFPNPADALETWIHFAFGAVLADSVARSGRYWSEARLESAYRRHVTERCAELTGRVPA